MIFRERATQAEYFDNPLRSPSEVADGYRWLNRVNRLLLSADPFQSGLPILLGAKNCRELRLLDLGAGDGALGRELSAWAAARGWRWDVTSLDLNPLAFANGPGPRHVVGSALAIPFPDNSFDAVIASLMTHHLNSEDEVRKHFQEAWRVTGGALLLVDTHRNRVAHAVMGLLLRILRCPREFREDGLLSIRRGWRVPEWRELASRAGIPSADVRLYFGSKLVLTACKSVPQSTS